MTDARPTRSISIDQMLPKPPTEVWRALTEPDLLARWWAPSDIAPVVGLDVPGWRQVSCEVLEVEVERRLVYSFTEAWTLTWTLVAEGRWTRLLLEHDGFDLDDPQGRFAYENMGRGGPTRSFPGSQRCWRICRPDQGSTPDASGPASDHRIVCCSTPGRSDALGVDAVAEGEGRRGGAVGP